MILGVAAAGTWHELLKREQPARGEALGCPISAQAPAHEALVSDLQLESVVPVPPGSVELGVLNGTDRRGLAGRVTAGLQVLGFTRAVTRGNDQLHPAGTMRCGGQIRFGRNGFAAARTLSLVVPCAQLVDDRRPDSTVDLILGAGFSDLDPSPAARTVLAQLGAGDDPVRPAGGVQSVAGPAARPVEPSLLSAAHQGLC